MRTQCDEDSGEDKRSAVTGKGSESSFGAFARLGEQLVFCQLLKPVLTYVFNLPSCSSSCLSFFAKTKVGVK